MEKFDVIYNKVIELVKKDSNINAACKSCGISRTSFYTLMSEKQKTDLKNIKLLKSKHLTINNVRNKNDLYDCHEFFTSEDKAFD
jgi:hypothetical protein